MATTITVASSLSYEDAKGSEELAPTAFSVTPSNDGFQRGRQLIPTSETAINLGAVTSPGYAEFVNLDATNYVELKTGTGGVVFAKLLPNGGRAQLQLGSGAQAPYAIANSSSCWIDVFIVRV